MRAVDLIVKKRDGESLGPGEISFLIQGYVGGEVADYQMASLAMAIFFRGMSFEEYLTRAMIESGQTLDLSGVPGPLIDKHSTGGVGDKVSLVLAPLAAACGCVVPMMSGRGLGHTGGTLDKLEAIPGYRTDLSEKRFVEILRECGFAMTGQSERVVPADRQLYALRDVTGTVESVPLITASIMSKKFAEGAEALVFDVKCGSGAFMKTLETARELAVSLVRTGASLGRRIRAVISDMDQPLGRTAGNFLEVRESVEVLRGGGPRDLVELTTRLTAHMLVLGGLAPSVEEAEQVCRRRLDDGSAWDRFLANVEAQGGDVRTVEEPARGPRSKTVVPLKAKQSGRVCRIDAYRIGLAAGLLGAGRARKEDAVRPEAGIELARVRGDEVAAGDELCLLHLGRGGNLEEAMAQAEQAYTVAAEAVEPAKLILEELTSDAVGEE
jgi:pyrimidine-nucleoside phosphorylase